MRAALAWTAGAAALFALYLRIKVSMAPDSDTANNALQAWDMLHGHLLLHGWLTGDVPFYTFELPLMAIVEIFFGLHNVAMHVPMALVLLIITGCAVAIAVTDSRGGARAARAGVTVAVLAAPVLTVTEAWIPLGFPDHTGTAVFLLVPCLLIDRASSQTVYRAAAVRDLGRGPDRRRDRALCRGARHHRDMRVPGAGRAPDQDR